MNDREQKIKEFKALDDISHVLTVPARYIGSVNPTEIETYIFRDGKFNFEKITYTPGLLKIIEEIIDNSVDAYLNSSTREPITVKVNMTKTSVEVIDTGSGIPVVKYKDETGKLPELNGKYLAELAWGRLKAGGSFKEHRVGAGTHGEGSSLTNIFSKVFVGTTDDGKHKCKVTCKDNMHEISTKLLSTSGKSGTTVYFEPDLARFNLTEITQEHFDLVKQRLINLSISFPDLKFYFNNEKTNVNIKNFILAFSEHSIYAKSDNTVIGVFPSSNDEFQQYSYVNGLRIKDGGVHIDYIANAVINPIRDKLVKKYKALKPADIKNRIGLVVFLKDFENPQFNSQTKDELKNPMSDVAKHINGKIDFEKLAKDILKNDAIIGPIIDMFKLKEELKARQELKQAKKIKVKSDKYMSPIGQQKYLFLCEGQCLENNTEVFSLVENQSIKVKDLNIGDLVLSHNQKIQQVVGKSSTIKKCIKIKTKSGKEVICSENHRWFVFDTNTNTFKFKKTKNLNIKTDKLVSNKLKYGFKLSDINLTKWTGAEQNKYHFLMTGNGFEVATSSSHKFIVFDEYVQQFVVKEVRNINLKTDKLVLLEND